MTSHDPHPPEEGSLLLAQVRGVFERAVDDMPAAEQNRLRLMRRRLLAAPAVPGLHRWTLPLGVAASAILAGGIAWLSLMPEVPTRPSVATSSELVEAVTAAEDDAQLYAWLGEAPVAVASDAGEAL